MVINIPTLYYVYSVLGLMFLLGLTTITYASFFTGFKALGFTMKYILIFVLLFLLAHTTFASTVEPTTPCNCSSSVSSVTTEPIIKPTNEEPYYYFVIKLTLAFIGISLFIVFVVTLLTGKPIGRRH